MIYQLETIKNDLLVIIREAGNIIINTELNDISYMEKGECNFVSNLDYYVQSFLINAISQLIPNSIIISEESNQFICIDSKEYIWIIDPIDGTTNLIHNYPVYSISIALIRDSNVLLGLTYNPITKELFHAIKGQGAFLNNSRISVSKTLKLKDSLLGFGFPYNKERINSIVKLISETVNVVHDLRRTGSSALDLAYIACGRLDGYFEYDLELWDFAAGSLLVLESGGSITDWDNKILNFTRKNNILATNKKIHDELVCQIKNNTVTY